MVAVIITATILLLTVFALDYSKVEINFLNNSIFLQEENFKQELLNSSKIKEKSSVFFINKTAAKNHIEKQYPNLKVVNIETVFPNSLKFNLAQREETFAIKNTILELDEKNSYSISIIDADFKILKTISQEEYENIQIKPILIEFAGSHLINLSEGSFINSSEEIDLLKNLAKSFLINSRDVTEQKVIFKNITLLNNMLVLKLQDDFEIRVHNPQDELHLKLSAMFVRMGQIYPDYAQTHILEIHLTQDGQLLSKFTLKN